MKRKIHHDAVNNQEDEDSSTYPISFLSDVPIDRKQDKSIENSSAHFFTQESNNKDELTNNRKYHGNQSMVLVGRSKVPS